MGKLFEEIKRRKVFRVAAAYAVVAWILIQISGEILPALQMPEWTVSFVTVLLLLGFPVALLLAWAFELTPDGVRADAVAQPAQIAVQSTDRKLIYAILGLVLLVAGFQVTERFLFTEQQAVSQPLATADSPQNSPIMRFAVPLGEDADLYIGGTDSNGERPAATSLALSNDGNLLIYSAWERGADGQRSSQLYLRRLDQVAANPIEGTEGASTPFFSPDGSWIGFFVGNSLRRVAVTGGVADTIITETLSVGRAGVNWGDDGTIVYAGEGTGGVYRVRSSGGSGELIASPDSSMDQFSHYASPYLLPGSEVMLFHGLAVSLDPERAEIFAMNLDTGTQTSLLTNAMNPLYVAETGHLLFMRQGSLMAVGFDPDQLAIEGEPVLVEEDVMQALGMGLVTSETGAAQVAVSPAGHLVYARGGVYPSPQASLLRVAADGEAESHSSAALTDFNFWYLSLSPGDDRVVFNGIEGRRATIYVHDFTRDITQQLNTDGFRSLYPRWSPDGESIAFSSNHQDNISNIYRMPVDGSVERPERLAPSDQRQIMMSWSSDGVIAYEQDGDIWVLPPGGEPTPFFTSEVYESYATFSPDGDWLAYSAENPRGSELYVRPYPGPGAAILISGNGSNAPAWSRDGTQLYFQQNNASLQRGVMMVVDITEGSPSPARTLIDPWLGWGSSPLRSYDVFEDGGFLSSIISPQWVANVREGARANEIQVVLNFFEVLRQRVVD